MDRRLFLQILGIGVGGVALEQAIPFGRVWSFPKEIIVREFIELPPGSSARVIEMWDLFGCWVQRLDIIGPGLAAQPVLPRDSYKILRNIDKLYPEMVPEVPMTSFRRLRDAVDNRLGNGQFYGVSTRLP
jgi:hypothetical protein